LKIPVGTQKYFFGIYRKFGYAPLKSFAKPGLITCSKKDNAPRNWFHIEGMVFL